MAQGNKRKTLAPQIRDTPILEFDSVGRQRIVLPQGEDRFLRSPWAPVGTVIVYDHYILMPANADNSARICILREVSHRILKS